MNVIRGCSLDPGDLACLRREKADERFEREDIEKTKILVSLSENSRDLYGYCEQFPKISKAVQKKSWTMKVLAISFRKIVVLTQRRRWPCDLVHESEKTNWTYASERGIRNSALKKHGFSYTLCHLSDASQKQSVSGQGISGRVGLN